MDVRCYADALVEIVGAKVRENGRPIANNTRLVYVDPHYPDNEDIAIRLHDTNVVVYKPNGDIVLDSGGWRTVTTKDRMNRHTPPNVVVWAEKGEWYIAASNDRKRYVFNDYVRITKTGCIHGAATSTDEKSRKKLRKAAMEFVDTFIDKMMKGELPAPGRGDCIPCQFKQDGFDHIASHIEEGYYVPSLLTCACEKYPISSVARSFVHSMWWAPDTLSLHECFKDVVRRQLHSSLKRYVFRQLSLSN